MKAPPLHPHEARRLEALRRTELLDSAPSLEFDDATKLAAFICGTPIALVSLVDEHRQWFKSKVGLQASETPRDISFCGHAILESEVFVVPDAHADERFFDNPLVTGGPHVRFYAGAPLITATGDALGTLCVIDHEPRSLSDAQREALATLARQVVAQMHLLERTRALVSRAKETSQLNEFGELLQSCRTTAETNDVVAFYATRLFPRCHGAVSITKASRDMVETTVRWGDELASEPVFSPADCWGLRRGRPHVVTADEGGLVCAHVRHRRGTGYICVPMMAHGETLGILHVGEEVGASHDAQLQLAIAVAERIGVALANARLRETLRAQSIRDPLTGLFNRRYLEESLERDIRRCLRHERPLSVLMIDVDHFKRFNDEFGHEGGDLLLQAFGAELRRLVRAEDVVCRYGGEEFVVVLPEAGLAGALTRANELGAAAKALTVNYRGAPLRSVSLSIGLAMLGVNGGSTEELLRAADTALYRAKAEGRDRVVVASGNASTDAAHASESPPSTARLKFLPGSREESGHGHGHGHGHVKTKIGVGVTGAARASRETA